LYSLQFIGSEGDADFITRIRNKAQNWFFVCLFFGFWVFFCFSFAFYVQVLRLLKYLVIDSKDNVHLYQAIKRLDPFPEYPAFEELRTTQLKIKYSKGPYSLLEVSTF